MPRRSPPGCFWRGSTLWGRATIAGREHRWSLRTDDGAVATARRKAEVERLRGKIHFGDERLRWPEVVVRWGAAIASQIGPRTAQRYAVSLRQLEPYLMERFLDEIDRKLVGEIVRRRRQVASVATVRRDLTALSSVLAFAIEEGWREDNPALTTLQRRTLRERRDPIVLPDPAHIRLVIKRAPGALSALIETAWLTGARLDELVSAQRRQLDHARRELSIIGKGRKLRTIALSDGAYEAIRRVPLNMASRHIFWHSDGRPYANVSSRFRALVLAAAAEAGPDFRPFRFHDLRHRFAVDFLQSGRGSIYDLQLTLGHSSVKTTELYLAFLAPEDQARAKAGLAQKTEQVQRFGNAETLAG